MLTATRDIKRGGPTGRMTRGKQAEWTGSFRALMEYRFMPKYFDIDNHRRVWTPVSGVVFLWRGWAGKLPNHRHFTDASATTITAALKAMGYTYSPSRYRFTPDPRKVRPTPTRGMWMPPARSRWGTWDPDCAAYQLNKE